MSEKVKLALMIYGGAAIPAGVMLLSGAPLKVAAAFWLAISLLLSLPAIHSLEGDKNPRS